MARTTKVVNVQFVFSCENLDLSDEDLSCALCRTLNYYEDGRYGYYREQLNDAIKRLFRCVIDRAVQNKMLDIYKNEMVASSDGKSFTNKGFIEADKKLMEIRSYLICDDIESSIKTKD